MTRVELFLYRKNDPEKQQNIINLQYFATNVLQWETTWIECVYIASSHIAVCFALKRSTET